MFTLLKFTFVIIPKLILWIFPGIFGWFWNPFKMSYRKAIRIPLYKYHVTAGSNQKLSEKGLKRLMKRLKVKAKNDFIFHPLDLKFLKILLKREISNNNHSKEGKRLFYLRRGSFIFFSNVKIDVNDEEFLNLDIHAEEYNINMEIAGNFFGRLKDALDNNNVPYMPCIDIDGDARDDLSPVYINDSDVCCHRFTWSHDCSDVNRSNSEIKAIRKVQDTEVKKIYKEIVNG